MNTGTILNLEGHPTETMLSLIRIINDPRNQATQLSRLLKEEMGDFVLCLGSTETSDITGISAAGASAGDRQLTPSIDADLLKFGRTRSGESVPVSPVGIVSPVVISRACLQALKISPRIVDCGTVRKPLESDLTAGTTAARCASTGHALPYETVLELFEKGRAFARDLDPDKYLILGECVPGGTTTALATLRAFDVKDADTLVSCSLPSANDIRVQVANEGLRKSGLFKSPVEGSDPVKGIYPLRAIAAVGDPMQPFAMGLAIEASRRAPVVLAGGSQMLAIYFLCRQMSGLDLNLENIFVVTTKWIAADKYSNTKRLSEIVDAPFFASVPDFSRSRFAGLRAYEDGHVKEGVGAGALMLAAMVGGRLSAASLMDKIDDCYDELVLGSTRIEV